MCAIGRVDARVDFEQAVVAPIAGTEFAGEGLLFRALAATENQLEIAPPDFYWGSKFLNVGYRPFVAGSINEDGIEITLTGGWNVVGVSFVDGTLPGNGERVVFYGANGRVLTEFTGPLQGNFAGMFAPEPIVKIVVEEAANDGDDVGYDNFLLATIDPNAYPRIWGRLVDGQIELSWARCGAMGFRLVTATEAGAVADEWTPVGVEGTPNGNFMVLLRPVEGERRFYKLRL